MPFFLKSWSLHINEKQHINITTISRSYHTCTYNSNDECNWIFYHHSAGVKLKNTCIWLNTFEWELNGKIFWKITFLDTYWEDVWKPEWLIEHPPTKLMAFSSFQFSIHRDGSSEVLFAPDLELEIIWWVITRDKFRVSRLFQDTGVINNSWAEVCLKRLRDKADMKNKISPTETSVALTADVFLSFISIYLYTYLYISYIYFLSSS